MLYLPGGGAMLFLTDVDHVSFEKANETRQNNLQSATVSLQVVIGLCKRKETAALKIKAATDKFIRARKIVCPAAAFFFSAAGQMWLGVKYLFNASVKHKCYTNVRGSFDFDRKTG